MATLGTPSRTPQGSRALLSILGLTLLALSAACSEGTSQKASVEPSAPTGDGQPRAAASDPAEGDATSEATPPPPAPPPTTPWSEAFATWPARLESTAETDPTIRTEFKRWLADLAADLQSRSSTSMTLEFRVDANTLGQACQFAEQALSTNPIPLDDLAKWLDCVPSSGPSDIASYHSYLLAYILVLRGAYEQALASLLGVERRFPGEAHLLEERWTVLAQVYREIGSRREAQMVSDKLLNHLRKLGKEQSESYARALAVRADIAMEFGQMDRALSYLDTAREISVAVKNQDIEFEIYMTMLDALLAQGRCERILQMTASLKERPAAETAQIQVLRGTALLHLGRFDHVLLAEASATLDTALRCSSLPTEFRAFAINRRIEVALAKGDVAHASRIAAEQSPDRSLLRDQLTRDSGTVPLFDLISLLSEIEIADPSESFHEQLELHRSAFQSLLRSWRALGVDAESIGRMHLAWPNRLITRLMQLEIAAEPKPDGLTNAAEVLLQSHAAFGLANAIPGPTTSLTKIQEAIADDQGILAIQTSPTRSLATWIEKGDLAIFEIPSSTSIDALARRLNQQLDGDGTSAESTESTMNALAASVLPPELRLRVESTRRLTIAGADLLGNPAFEVLPHSAGGSLGEHVAIDRTTSLQAWHRLRTRDGRLREAVFVGSLSPSPLHRGVDRESTGSLPLDFSRRVLEAWPTRSVRLFVDQAGTVDAALRAAVHPERFVHILGHGVWDAESEVGAVIALTPSPSHPNGLLSEHGIRSLPSCAPIIMLSSCRIGATKQRIGDSDLNSLGGAFLQRGARAVIQSRFPLRVGSHNDLATRVHATLATGATAAEAVRQARYDLARHSRTPDLLREIALEVIGQGH